MKDELYVLEWSKKQGLPHVQPLETTLAMNRVAYRDDKAVGDYIPLFVGTFREVSDAADAIRQTLMKRRLEKAVVLTP